MVGLGAAAGMALGDPPADYASIAAVGLFVALMCVCIVVGHLLEENRWMNESTTALFIGLGTGAVILFASSGKHSRVLLFSEDLFFIYLLPPIIFNAGFQVKKKQFFRNFITITLFGAVGTLISFTVISLGALGLISRLDIGALELGDYLALGAIFSATDSVCTLQVLSQDETPFLYSLVFGEGVVNDATSVVLFNAIQNFDLGNINTSKLLKFIGSFLYLFSTSTILGVAAGLLSAYIIKKLYFGRHSTDREVSIMMLMAYLSYMLAELLDLSGILTVFFCGIVMSHYTWHNVTESSRVTTKHAFATLSFIAETFLFLYVGMDALDIEKWKIVGQTYSPVKSVALSSTILALVLVARAAFVFPLSLLSNLTKKTPAGKISFKQQVIVWWAGLMRGAVSIALAYNKFTRSGHTQQPSNAIMITSRAPADSNPSSLPYPLPFPFPSAPPLAMATTMSLRSLAMAMADAALPPAHKLLPTVSLPLLSSSTRAAPLLLRANRRLPLAPLVASSDAVEAGVEWADEEEEEVVGEAFDEEVGEAEEEVVASGDEEEEGGDGDGEYAAVEPPEEAKVYVGNLPYDVDSEGLAQLFDQAGVVEVAEVIYNRESGQSRGFGFVTMSTIEEADKAIEMFNRYDISGRLLNVNRASPRGARMERPPRQFASAFRAYVGNLPWQVDDSRLVQLFSEHGEVVNATVVYDRETGRSRGFGFVTMASKDELDDAISALDGQELDGRPLRVNVAAERPQRGF